ncbi:MAG: efflux RND transporter periplasmic adaptor subunit [Kordiimonadaceae bacterium]|nr:efflux RND transporter periplasmic adaptor subunit [Kordiimonadaceae bacterium]
MRYIANRCRSTIVVGLLCWLALGSHTVVVASPESPESSGAPETQTLMVATGVMKSARSSMLGPTVPGVVDKIFVKVGDFVEKGQPLFRIRQNDFKINQRKAKAALELALARTEVSKKQHRRVAELYETANISESALDESEAATAVLVAEQAVSQSALDAAEQALSDTIVKAPYAGMIASKPVSEGVYKSVQAFSGNGGIVEVQEAGIMVAILFVPVKHVSKVKLGQKVSLIIDGINKKYSGEIAVINHQADTASNMLEFRVAVTNKDFLIKDGQPVVARIINDTLMSAQK